MRRILRHRPSPALVIACLALTIALGGTSYAAVTLPRNSVGTRQLKRNAVNTLKVRNYSLLRVDFKRGQIPAGARGPTGATGATGPTGPAGPFPDGNLPSGKTLRGFYSAAGSATAAQSLATADISFIYALATAPIPHFIAAGAAPPAECPGTEAAPAASPGHLCVYEGYAENEGLRGVTSSNGADGSSTRYGAAVFVTRGALTTARFWTEGTWAVTAL